MAIADGSPRASAYHDIVDAFHAAVLHAGAQARFLHAEQWDELTASDAARRFPVLVAAAFYVATTGQLEKLRAYAAAGGHLVVGPRTGYGDEESRARFAVAPDVVGPAGGVHYEEFTSLRAPVPVVGEGMAVSGGATGQWWADHLLVDDADVLARYEHPQLGRFPAVTTRAHGRGRITYVGTVPDRTLGADLVRHLVPTPVAAAWRRDTPVTVLSGVANGTRVHFVHNWSGSVAHAVTPHGVDDIVGGVPLPAGHRLTLDPWDSLVLADTTPPIDPVRQFTTEGK